MNVRFCLPWVICWTMAWTISADCRKRWKLTKTRTAELSFDARALMERMAASGSAATGVGSLPVALAGKPQPGTDIPDGQTPVLLVAHPGDLAKGVFVLVRLNPDAGETGGNVLGQTLGKCHGGPRDYDGVMNEKRTRP